MASSLLNTNPNYFLRQGSRIYHKPAAAAISSAGRCVSIRCGPRDGRGPLVKGRTLSIEAIQAVQSLKRAQRSSNPENLSVTLNKTLPRLLKSDLVAALKELLRQDECALALEVLRAIKTEYPGPEISLYAEVAVALGRTGDGGAIDRLVAELEEDGVAIDWGDKKGLGRLLTAVVNAGGRESTVKIYELMRKSGWGTTCTVDDHIVKVLIRGFKRFGDLELADEIEREFGGIISSR